MIKSWFMETPNMTEAMWDDNKAFLQWMAGNHGLLEQKVLAYTKEVVVQEVVQVMTAGGGTAKIGTSGIIEGVSRAMSLMSPEDRQQVKDLLTKIVNY